MLKTKPLISLVLAITVLVAQAGAVLAAPALQDPAPITGTIQSITLGTDTTTGITIVLVNLLDVSGSLQTVRVSLETAITLGLVVLASDGSPVLNDLALGWIEISPAIVLPDEEADQHPIGSALATFFSDIAGIDYGTIMAAHDQGFGFGVIAQALWLTTKLEGDADIFDRFDRVGEDGPIGSGLAGQSASVQSLAEFGDHGTLPVNEKIPVAEEAAVVGQKGDLEVARELNPREVPAGLGEAEREPQPRPVDRDGPVRHRLRRTALDRIALWQYGDYVFRPEWDIMSAMDKARRCGFSERVDTSEMFARVFAGCGAKVLIVARHLKDAEAAAQELGKAGGTVSACAGDVTKLSDMEAMARTAAERHGGLDVLCANAGIFPQAKIEEMSPETWDEVMNTNLKGTFFAIKACVPHLKKSDQGRIVITSSITGPVTGYPGWTHYGATKAGQLGFMRTACIELAKYGITVNAVMPGNIVTEGLQGLGEDYLKTMAASIPLKRLVHMGQVCQVRRRIAASAAPGFTRAPRQAFQAGPHSS